MTFTITAQGCGSFTASADSTLLDAGLTAGFGFPHACRNGNCERCLATLVTGEVQYRGNLGERLLTRHGEQALLCCQAYPLSNCTFQMAGLTAPGNLPLVEKTCQIVELRPLNHDVSLLRLLLPAGLQINWYAGQYAMLRLGKRWRPFSIANAPGPGKRELQFHIRHLSHHYSAQENLAWLKQHSLLRVRLPQGQCFLSEPPAQPIWFICGSTGFAQSKAMLEHLADRRYSGDVRLFWGARQADDFYLPKAASQLAKRLPHLKYELVLSDQKLAPYQQGQVHQRVLANLAQPEQPLFIISGSPAMVQVVNQALLAAGVSHKQVLSDMLPAIETASV